MDTSARVLVFPIARAGYVKEALVAKKPYDIP
jgi:hypothetical protein